MRGDTSRRQDNQFWSDIGSGDTAESIEQGDGAQVGRIDYEALDWVELGIWLSWDGKFQIRCLQRGSNTLTDSEHDKVNRAILRGNDPCILDVCLRCGISFDENGETRLNIGSDGLIVFQSLRITKEIGDSIATCQHHCSGGLLDHEAARWRARFGLRKAA